MVWGLKDLTHIHIKKDHSFAMLRHVSPFASNSMHHGLPTWNCILEHLERMTLGRKKGFRAYTSVYMTLDISCLMPSSRRPPD